MIVATAGHIDHGKTSLVKALTGVETDRLPEERARGISIDIGFAYWTIPGGATIGFVDVPGHERFIHNMLAGVAAIDFALLVVAADDGVMPQTREHLDILDLLGVANGLVALTKADRASPERIAQVRIEVQQLLAPTKLAGCAALPVSAIAGTGMAQLRSQLADAAARWKTRAHEGRAFRLSIDRSFSAQGSGTVVTGTVLDGEVAAGDRLYVSPAGTPVRVRGLHKRGAAADRAVAGERCALNIVGVEPAQAARGSWLVAGSAHAPSQRMDALARMLPSARRPLKHWDPVHVHLGTADVLARVVMPGESLAAAEEGVVQLALEQPVAAARGDRFVIRDASAQSTVGGGWVIDPFASHPRRQREVRAMRLAAMREPNAALAWDSLLRNLAQGVPVQPFRRAFNLTPHAMKAVLEASGAVLPGGDQGSAFSISHHAAISQMLVAAVQEFHEQSPHAAGTDTDRLLRAALPGIGQRERLAVLKALAATGAIEIRGSLVRARGFVPAARNGDDGLWRQLMPHYASWGVNVPLLREVAARSAVTEARLRDFLKQRTVSGDMVRISPERFLPRAALARLAQHVVELSAARQGAPFTIAEYRDVTGTGRNLAIETLEYFDRLGLTQRGGGERMIRCVDEKIAAFLRSPDWRPGALRQDARNSK